MVGARVCVVGVLVAGAAACSSPSTVLVTLTAPGDALASLTLEVDEDQPKTSVTRTLGVEPLPATAIVIVSDAGPLVHVHADAQLADLTTVSGDGTVRSVPNTEVPLELALGTPGGDAGVVDLSGDDFSGDLGPIDLKGVDLVGSVLAEDTFQRADQVLWGTPTSTLVAGQQAWGGDANLSANDTIFAIMSDTGTVTDTGSSSKRGQLGAKVDDADVQATASFTGLGAYAISVTIRVVDGNNYYELFADGSNLGLRKIVGSTKMPITMVSFAMTMGTAYTLRLQAIGTMLAGKIWPASSQEPSGFLITASDSQFSNGQCGVRALTDATGEVSFTHFIARQY